MITPVLYSNEQIKAFIFVALKGAVPYLVPWKTGIAQSSGAGSRGRGVPRLVQVVVLWTVAKS